MKVETVLTFVIAFDFSVFSQQRFASHPVSIARFLEVRPPGFEPGIAGLEGLSPKPD